MPPDEIERRVASGAISMRELIMQAMVQAMSAPLTGSELFNLAFPKVKQMARKSKHNATNNETFEALLAMRNAKRNGPANGRNNK